MASLNLVTEFGDFDKRGWINTRPADIYKRMPAGKIKKDRSISDLPRKCLLNSANEHDYHKIS